MTHLFISKLIMIGSANGLSPRWRQAIIWTNASLKSKSNLCVFVQENAFEIVVWKIVAILFRS